MKTILNNCNTSSTLLSFISICHAHLVRLIPVLVLLTWFATTFANEAYAQWTATIVQPIADPLNQFVLYESRFRGVFEGQQVGWRRSHGNFTLPAPRHAFLWNSTAESAVSLHPTGALQSEAFNNYAGQQVGYIEVGNGLRTTNRASLWSGSANSRVDLNPDWHFFGSFGSVALDIHDGQQVGYIDRYFFASLWSGTAESWVNLNPFGTGASFAIGVHSGQQVGAVSNFWNGASSPALHASLWTGTATSWVDLNPEGASSSQASAVYAGQQVGWANINGAEHASLWTGLAESWINLHPEGATSSKVWDVHSGHQVGEARIDGMFRASYWNGTAESWEDLSLALPGTWYSSHATSVWSDGSTIQIVGYGSRGGYSEGILWTRSIPEPTSLAMVLLGMSSLLYTTRRRRAGDC